MKSPVERQLLDALTELDKAIQAMPAIEGKPNFLLLFARIDELAEKLPPDADPQLRHFLQRKSYEKARLFLEGQAGEIVKGRCG